MCPALPSNGSASSLPEFSKITVFSYLKPSLHVTGRPKCIVKVNMDWAKYHIVQKTSVFSKVSQKVKKFGIKCLLGFSSIFFVFIYDLFPD